MTQHIRPLSELLKDFLSSLSGDSVTVAGLLEAFHERGFGMPLFVIALPMALPLPVPPGINVLMALPLILLTAQLALGRHTLWIPKSLHRKTLSRTKVESLLGGAIPWVERMERFVKPRLGFVTQGIFSHAVGILGLLMALTVCVPLPLTNTVPSLGIAMMGMGLVMRDGLTVLAGAFVGTLWICLLAAALLFLGTEGIEIVKEFVKSFL